MRHVADAARVYLLHALCVDALLLAQHRVRVVAHLDQVARAPQQLAAGNHVRLAALGPRQLHALLRRAAAHGEEPKALGRTLVLEVRALVAREQHRLVVQVVLVRIDDPLHHLHLRRSESRRTRQLPKERQQRVDIHLVDQTMPEQQSYRRQLVSRRAAL